MSKVVEETGLSPGQIWTLFHRAWTTSAGRPGYDKALWRRLQGVLAGFVPEVPCQDLPGEEGS